MAFVVLMTNFFQSNGVCYVPNERHCMCLFRINGVCEHALARYEQ